MPAGSYLGEDLLPVPEKLVQKITKLEFVEMRDLIPETWLLDEEECKKATAIPALMSVCPSSRYSTMATMLCGLGGSVI